MLGGLIQLRPTEP
uniref:Uncharacterized protein n=1 Tax=Arundo donax TaxID=35708 RepID=A0A0A9AUS9_ARUDO